jgi:thiamine pyrophosphate-dependent acetolactate synthase large subunit-like protein
MPNAVVPTVDKETPHCAEDAIDRAMQLLQTAQRPLVIVGKGSQYARAEHVLNEFINRTRVPFLPTPMVHPIK